MIYLEAVKWITRIEEKYDVMKIKYKGLSVWPLLRVRVLEYLTGDDKVRKSTGSSAIKQVLKTLFYYNPLLYFKRYRIWVFSHNGSRNAIKEQRIERTTGCVIDAEPSTLFVEKPDAHQTDYPRKSIPEKQIVSESWLLMFTHFIARLYPLNRIKINNVDLLEEILSELTISFNYYSAIRLMIIQKKVFDALLYITYKPQTTIIECPYTVMGYVWSMHEHGIRVIEMQHGVLNKHHYAYNSLFHSDLLYPDEMWVFGDEEYKYMKSEECHYCKTINKTGLYFLEYARDAFKSDPFINLRSDYSTICLVAGQTGYEEAMAEYVALAAKQNKDCVFIYVPRKPDAIIKFESSNIIFRPGVNIYEYMIWCDIHLTISSTTCLECHYYHKPTVFYNYKEMASSYYGDILKNENGAVYTEGANSFRDARNLLKSKTVVYKEIFTHNTVEVMHNLLTSI